jgi:predicted mannosyl-3-phosphoglycerate phosphatase (HAD superfamily)
MKIAIDFDGTCVEHDYPETGRDIGAIPVLKELVEKGHQLILHTMRTGVEMHYAQRWFSDNGIPLFGVQYDPEQTKWTHSNKCYCHLNIDDVNLGIPLKTENGRRPWVDWVKVRELLVERGIL